MVADSFTQQLTVSTIYERLRVYVCSFDDIAQAAALAIEMTVVRMYVCIPFSVDDISFLWKKTFFFKFRFATCSITSAQPPSMLRIFYLHID